MFEFLSATLIGKGVIADQFPWLYLDVWTDPPALWVSMRFFKSVVNPT